MYIEHGLSLFLLTALAIKIVFAYPNGAPSSACESMIPNHQVAPQTSISGYSILLSSTSFTAGGPEITVTLLSPSNMKFMGFLLRTQYANNRNTIEQYPGKWMSSPVNTKDVCGKAKTHNGVGDAFESAVFTWKPPDESDGHVILRATFVQRKSVFWTDVMQVIQDRDSDEPMPDLRDRKAEQGMFSKDSNCGNNKGCFSKCNKDGKCDYLLSWEPLDSLTSVRIKMKGNAGKGHYIAFGLSMDEKMGSDSVTYCVNEQNGVHSSWNSAGGKNNVPVADNQNAFSNMDVDFEDGVLTCTFDQLIAGSSDSQRFSLKDPHSLFFAVGFGTADGIGQHIEIPSPSASPVSLATEFNVDISADTRNVMILSHGSLMIAAWIGFATIGIIVARYYKGSWQRSTLCGQKVWFQLHRTCMILTFLTTISGVVIIVVEVGGYSHSAGIHPILGIITASCCILNPVMAIFRPHPNTKNRWLFNWAHWTVGIGAYSAGIMSILYGLMLEKAGAPIITVYIVAGFVGCLLLVSLVLACIGFCISGKANKRGYATEIQDFNSTSFRSLIPDDARNGMLPKCQSCFLCLYMVLVMATVITLIYFIFLG